MNTQHLKQSRVSKFIQPLYLISLLFIAISIFSSTYYNIKKDTEIKILKEKLKEKEITTLYDTIRKQYFITQTDTLTNHKIKIWYDTVSKSITLVDTVFKFAPVVIYDTTINHKLMTVIDTTLTPKNIFIHDTLIEPKPAYFLFQYSQSHTFDSVENGQLISTTSLSLVQDTILIKGDLFLKIKELYKQRLKK